MANTKGGKKYKKGKKGKGKTTGKKAETPLADSPGLLYAQVKSKLGGDRLDVECSDGIPRQAIIPGSFYKRVWINKNDIILTQINELNTKEAFILYKYDPNEAHNLKNQGLLKFDLGELEHDDGIQFGEDDSEEEEDEDKVHDEVDKVQKEAQKSTSDDEVKPELTPQAKKVKVKQDNLKRQNDRKSKHLNDDGELNIDAI
jgi:translation initiation factor 1A